MSSRSVSQNTEGNVLRVVAEVEGLPVAAVGGGRPKSLSRPQFSALGG